MLFFFGSFTASINLLILLYLLKSFFFFFFFLVFFYSNVSCNRFNEFLLFWEHLSVYWFWGFLLVQKETLCCIVAYLWMGWESQQRPGIELSDLRSWILNPFFVHSESKNCTSSTSSGITNNQNVSKIND